MPQKDQVSWILDTLKDRLHLNIHQNTTQRFRKNLIKSSHLSNWCKVIKTLSLLLLQGSNHQRIRLQLMQKLGIQSSFEGGLSVQKTNNINICTPGMHLMNQAQQPHGRSDSQLKCLHTPIEIWQRSKGALSQDKDVKPTDFNNVDCGISLSSFSYALKFREFRETHKDPAQDSSNIQSKALLQITTVSWRLSF